MSKQSGYLRRIHETVERQRVDDAQFTRQLVCDLALMTLHEEFGFGPERAKRFVEGLAKRHSEISDLWYEDKEYCMNVLDRALEPACGKYYAPHTERYKGFTGDRKKP